MAFWGPIIGAGISAIGSLFGGGDDEETTTTIDYKAMARAAEKAGFNPLTAIRNGGSAGFTTTHSPGLSMSDRFGQAFQTIGNALMSFDARADERAELEQKLLQAQLGQINRIGGASQRLWSFDVPQAAGMTRSTSPASTAAGGMNMTKNFGGFTKAPFEPVTEYDELAAGLDQLTTDVKRVWEADPIWKWWEGVSKPKAATPLVFPPMSSSSRPRWPATPTPGYNRHALGW